MTSARVRTATEEGSWNGSEMSWGISPGLRNKSGATPGIAPQIAREIKEDLPRQPKTTPESTSLRCASVTALNLLRPAQHAVMAARARALRSLLTRTRGQVEGVEHHTT